MANTRALIVDDSRSARTILGRMLESFGLEVDAVESAELALTYLQTARPDVIFMDHLMPGMDGFAAVRVIKANPDTATIPVLMYTSQEGEMYLSQARALGAMGVLPKTLKHADVAAALEHLNLPTATPGNAPRAAVTPTHTGERDVTPRAGSVETIAKTNEVQYESVPAALNLPQLAHRIAAEVHAELERQQLQNPSAEQRWRRWTLVAGIVVAVLLGVMIYQQLQMQQQLSQLQAAQPTGRGVTSVPVATSPALAATPVESAVIGTPIAAPAIPRVEIEAVPYGEVPLAGARLERLRKLLDALRNDQVRGELRVEVFLADFCLTGNPVQGYAPADDDLLVARCDVVGNPFGDALTVQQRQSVAFANLVASINSNTAGGIKVQLVDGGHKPLVPYPAPSATLTAAAWNASAERNQRVVFTLPATPLAP